jgi:exosome complex RNA-binding protein Rrp4
LVRAELLRHQGFDGIGDRSAMNDDGYNIALFDLGAANLAVCHLMAIEKVSYERHETTNRWCFENGDYVTNVITDIKPVNSHISDEKKAK